MAIEIVDLPIKNGDFPVRYVNVEGIRLMSNRPPRSRSCRRVPRCTQMASRKRGTAYLAASAESVKVAPWRTSAINGNLNGKNTSLSLYAYHSNGVWIFKPWKYHENYGNLPIEIYVKWRQSNQYEKMGQNDDRTWPFLSPSGRRWWEAGRIYHP